MNAMIAGERRVELSARPSAAARERMCSHRGEPLFVAGWRRVLMLHFAVDVAALQRAVPYPLDLHEGRAFVSLVAFSMEGMRPRRGGRLAAAVFRPVATHDFLNVRTYVRRGGESGIHFLAEWLSSRLAVTLGPTVFGLPYRYGRIDYRHDERAGVCQGTVAEARGGGRLEYTAQLAGSDWRPAAAGSRTEWLMERYTAFNAAGPVKRFFRVWHPPWPQVAAVAAVGERTLLTDRWPWFREAVLAGANYSPGFGEVWMGRPHFSATDFHG